MSGIAGLSNEIINAITANLEIEDFTRAELRNFLRGNITTVTDEGEFTTALKGIAQDVEVGTSLPEGQVTGEILGALEGGGVISILEGGLITAKGLEIANSILEIYNKNAESERVRIVLRDRLLQNSQRGVFHGAMGTPTRDPNELIEQLRTAQARAAAKRQTIPDERKFGNDDPIRQRLREPVEDTFDDAKEPLLDLEDPDDSQGKKKGLPKNNTSKAAAGVAAGIIAAGAAAAAAGGTFTPVKITSSGRRPDVRPTPPNTITPERTNPGSNEQSPVGVGTLRADFEMLGISYFNKIFDTPMATQNSEWVDFDYVPNIDKQNGIQMNNFFGDAIRFKNPLFLPKFQAKLAPPSKLAVGLKYIPMRREVQLYQPFVNKFDGADMGKKMSLTDPFNRSVFDSNFKNLELYNPV